MFLLVTWTLRESTYLVPQDIKFVNCHLRIDTAGKPAQKNILTTIRTINGSGRRWHTIAYESKNEDLKKLNGWKLLIYCLFIIRVRE